MSESVILEVFPYLCVDDANAAVEFYRRAFGAEEVFPLTEPGGWVGHVELKLVPVTLMLSEEYPGLGICAPRVEGGASFTLHLHVDDCDEAARRVVEAGAEMVMEAVDQFHGERSCRLRDPFRHQWMLGHGIEQMSIREMQHRYNG